MPDADDGSYEANGNDESDQDQKDEETSLDAKNACIHADNSDLQEAKFNYTFISVLPKRFRIVM